MAKHVTKRTRRSFTPEYKAEVVELVLQGDQPIAQVARNLDLSDSMVRKWISEAVVGKLRVSAGSDAESEAEELRRLRNEVKQLRMEREILEKAAVSSTGHCPVCCNRAEAQDVLRLVQTCPERQGARGSSTGGNDQDGVQEQPGDLRIPSHACSAARQGL